MAARAYWKGHLRLSLVSIKVELFSAVAHADEIRLNQIHKPSGKRIRYEKVVPGIGPVDTDEIVKGYKIGKDEYVVLEPEELDEIKLESRETIDLVQFVDHCEVDPRYFEKPYYVIPADEEVAAEGFAVIREALRDTQKVGLGQMASRGRDYVVAIKPCGEGLLLETLRYADEVRESDKIFEAVPDIKVDKEMKELAEELISRKAKPFKAENFQSGYTEALRDLIEEKRKSGAVSTSGGKKTSKDDGKVVDLKEALKKSVSKGNSSKSASGKSSKRKTG